MEERCFHVVLTAIVAMQRSGKHASTTIEGLCFLLGPCRGVTLKIIGAPIQLQDIRRTVTT
jgi:hypothetical protein